MERASALDKGLASKRRESLPADYVEEACKAPKEAHASRRRESQPALYLQEVGADSEESTDSGSEATMLSVPSGQDTDVARDSLPTDIEELRQETRSLLVRALEEGTLIPTLKKITPRPVAEPDHGRDQLEEALVQACGPAAPKADRVPVEETRRNVKEVLMGAAASGRLQQVVSEQMPAALSRPGLDDLRLNLKQAMSTAVREGRFAAAIRETKLDATRKRAREALTKAVLKEDSCPAVEYTLKQKEDQAEMTSLDALRREARDVLADAVADGRLCQVLLEVQQERVEEQALSQQGRGIERIRAEAGEALLRATANGSLQDELKRAVQARRPVIQEDSQEVPQWDLKLQARKSLSSGVLDGRLEQVLTKLQQNKDAKEPPAKAKQEGQKDCQARGRAKDFLLKGALNGRVAAAVDEVKRESSGMEALRRSCKEVLVKGVLTGSLPSAIEQVRHNLPNASTADQADIPVEPAQADAADPAAIRQRARGILAVAALNGRLALPAKTELRMEPAPTLPAEPAASAEDTVPLVAASTAAPEAHVQEGPLTPSPKNKRMVCNFGFEKSLTPVFEEPVGTPTRLKCSLSTPSLAYRPPTPLPGCLRRSPGAGSGRKSEAASPATSPVPSPTSRQRRRIFGAVDRASKAGESLPGAGAEEASESTKKALASRRRESLPADYVEEASETMRKAFASRRRESLPADYVNEAPKYTYSKGLASKRRESLPADYVEEARKASKEGLASKRRESFPADYVEGHRKALKEACASPRDADVKELPKHTAEEAFIDLTEDGAGEEDNDAASMVVSPPTPTSRLTPSASPPCSRHGARHRAHLAMSSAMAMDLDEQAVKSPGRPAPGVFSEYKSLAASAMALNLGHGTYADMQWGNSSRTATPTSMKHHRSKSLSTLLKTTKSQFSSGIPYAVPEANQMTTLPALMGTKQAPSEVVAWSRQLVRSNSRWGNMQAIF